MTTSSRRRLWWTLPVVVGAAVGLWFLGPNAVARAQQEQPTMGPNPQAGETVYAPKKSTKPQRPQQPEQPQTQQPAQSQPTPQEKQPEKINPKQIYTLSTQSNLVNVNVLVTDQNGNPISGLSKNNFQVLDDGVSQTVTNFSTAKAPMTVCMVIEFSNRWWPFLYLALEDSYQFLNFMQPKDWVAVVDFDLNPHILQDFTQDRFQVRSALDTLRVPGFSESNLYDALAFTLNRMRDIQGRKAIVAVVTGFDTMSKLTYGQMLKIAKGSNTPIYPISVLEWVTIRYGGEDNWRVLQARNGLTWIAKYSGGQAYFPRFEGALPGIYRQIAGQLRQEYSLGFVPTDAKENGKYHKLEVKLVGPQGNPLIITNQKGKKVKYRIVARGGYYARKG